jgi:hypothetical protein
MTCIGCDDKIYRLATRGDGTHAVERCDTCSEHLTDNEALFIAGQEGRDWINSGPHPVELTRIVSRDGVGGKHFWCVELKSSVHGRWIVVSEHLTSAEAEQGLEYYKETA